MELTPVQARVLGVLVEKEAITPDQYPLSSNALTLGCNQRNNRDPLTDHTEREVDAALLELRAAGLARTVHAAGARVPKHRHVLDEAWGLDRRQLAILAVLLLRGPNTLHELLTRTERYVAFDATDDVRAVLDTLADRDPALVVELPRRPGQREVRFTHLLHGEPAEGDPAARGAPGEAPVAPTTAPAPAPGSPAPASGRDLAAEVDALRAALADLNGRFEELCRRLGDDA